MPSRSHDRPGPFALGAAALGLPPRPRRPAHGRGVDSVTAECITRDPRRRGTPGREGRQRAHRRPGARQRGRAGPGHGRQGPAKNARGQVVGAARSTAFAPTHQRLLPRHHGRHQRRRHRAGRRADQGAQRRLRRRRASPSPRRAPTRTVNTRWYTPAQRSKAEKDMKTALRKGTADDLNIYIGQPRAAACSAGRPSRQLRRYDHYGRRRHPRPVAAGRHGHAYNLGDTATHEVGHWLGLYHTFQGGCTGTATSSTTRRRRIARPSAARSAATPAPAAGLDPIANFMDYTDDACMDRFTAGQATRMQNAVPRVPEVSCPVRP